ncbi:MAG: hypothetical protein MUO52_02210 [Desulfobacterales bacterium]|nr:hypothetical protein [Desulfobacterales bacterium]
MEREIIQLIKDKGPLTGSEIHDAIGGDELLLWRTCRLSKGLTVRTLGRRYLRLDSRVEGFARLSPSILREFLTYSVTGFSEDPASLTSRADRISMQIEGVSRAKSQLAYDIASSVTSQFETEFPIVEHACFIIAGDIVHNMAHDVPRPERSTGRLVRGSDMDMVIVIDDLFPTTLMNRLDEAIYQEKYRLLITPHIREEIDYIVKTMVRVKEQLGFETFKHMVACKILHEGTLLYGSEDLFHHLKTLLRERGISRKLDAMEKSALVFRREAEEYLLSEDPQEINNDGSYLFYPVEESDEFE